MGGCENFGVAGIIAATGAVGRGDRSRMFVINGPMTVEQVAALIALTRLDPQDDPVSIEFDPADSASPGRIDYDDEELHEWWNRNVYGR
jgi:hypothetical protein